MSDETKNEAAPKTILMVDDDVDLVASNKTFLEKNGYATASVFSGGECLEKIGTIMPDLILLDMMMETWSEGNNVVKELRSRETTKDIPIILMSSLNFRTQMEQAAQAESYLDVEGYLVKPVDLDDLLAQVRKILKDE